MDKDIGSAAAAAGWRTFFMNEYESEYEKKLAAQKKKYREKNKERIAEQRRKDREKNKAEQRRKDREENKEEIRELCQDGVRLSEDTVHAERR